MEPPWDGGTSLLKCTWSHDQDSPMSIYGKNIKHLLRNRKADDLETWNAASGARVLPNLSNDGPGLTLTNFTARLNLLNYAFIWEKCKAMDFSETIVVYDIKVGRCR